MTHIFHGVDVRPCGYLLEALSPCTRLGFTAGKIGSGVKILFINGLGLWWPGQGLGIRAQHLGVWYLGALVSQICRCRGLRLEV